MSDTWKIFGITIIVLLAIISLILIFAYLSRECNSNADCGQNEICTYNHKCIPYPTTNKTTDLASSLILSIAIIITALIIRKGIKE